MFSPCTEGEGATLQIAIPEVQVTADILPGTVFYLHRSDSLRGLICVMGSTDAGTERRIVPLLMPQHVDHERVPMHETAFSGVGLIVQDARLVVDPSSAPQRAGPFRGVIVSSEGVFLPMQSSFQHHGNLNLSTGAITRGPIPSPWVKLSRWRIEREGSPPEVIYDSVTSHEEEQQ